MDDKRMLKVLLMFSLVTSNISRASQAAETSASFRIGVMIGGPAVSSHRRQSKFTWYAAEITVAKNGFGNIERIQKSEEVYEFSCNRSGELLRVSVSIATGEIVDVKNLSDFVQLQ
jgi:hypothetical protein